MIEQRQEGKLRSAFVGTGIVTDTDTEIQPQQDTINQSIVNQIE